jgi:uncharacterized protein YrzB (UPF0473 family)
LLVGEKYMADDKKVEQDNVDIVEIYDDNGDTVKFELLDTIEMQGIKYLVIAPLNEQGEIEEEEIEQVYITSVTPADDGQEVLEMIEDNEIIDKVFGEFKKRNKTNFEFV